MGAWTAVTESAEGLTVKGRLLVDDVPRARELRALIRAGAVTGLSIGYRTTKVAPRKGGGRTISGLDLFEVSPVAIPAHPRARITSAKAAAVATEESRMDTEQNGAVPDIAAIETKLGQLGESVKGLTPLAERLDKLEARVNRPHAAAAAATEPGVEAKAFVDYLRLGNALPVEQKSVLNVSSDPQGGYLAPTEFATEVIREITELSPIRAVASVRSTTSPAVSYPTRGDLTNAKWHGEMADREASDISFGQIEIPVRELSTFVDISNRLLGDAPQVEAEVRAAFAEDFAGKQALAFVAGDGILRPDPCRPAPPVSAHIASAPSRPA